MKKVYPLLITEKLTECANFYVQYFGFTKVFEQDWYIHLVHEKSGAELAFMIPNADSQPKELHLGFNGNGMVYGFEVADAEEEYNRLKDTDINIVHALKTEEWGQKHFIAQDPAGVYIDVVEQLAE